ncbi:MAG: DUF5606 domain-containing protein [Cytophagales bacterium]
MDLREVASISGKSGLFRILKPTRNGVILESIDEQKAKIIASSTSKVSILKEISMYTTGKVANTPLEEIFVSIKAKYADGVSIDVKTASNDDLTAFLGTVLPDFDTEKIYASDIKKLINWFNILNKFAPEVFELKNEEAEAASADQPAETTEAEAKPKKAKKETSAATKTTKSASAAGSKIKASQNSGAKAPAKTMAAKRGS